MSSIHEDQLTILAQQLATIREQIEELKEKDAAIVAESFNLLKKARLKKHSTIYGCFTRCNGKTTKQYTCETYLDLKEQMEEAKALAEVRGLYNKKQGADYVKFTTNS
jgi:hypothetical protein